MTKRIAHGWTLAKFADHYVKTLDRPADTNGIHKSPIFGDSKNILLIAVVRFGQAKADRVFRAAIAKAEDKLQ